MKRIYVAGSIEGKTHGFARAWRRKAADLARDRGVDVLDPTSYDGLAEGLSASEVVIRDTYLLSQADAILADGRWPIGVGTSMEILEAYKRGKLTVVWGATRKSLFLQHHTAAFVETVEDGVNYIIDLLDLAR